jgi:hypothetical protein
MTEGGERTRMCKQSAPCDGRGERSVAPIWIERAAPRTKGRKGGQGSPTKRQEAVRAASTGTSTGTPLILHPHFHALPALLYSALLLLAPAAAGLAGAARGLLVPLTGGHLLPVLGRGEKSRAEGGRTGQDRTEGRAGNGAADRLRETRLEKVN